MKTIIDAMMEKFTIRIKTKTPDGEGGNVPTWSDGGMFYAAISKHHTEKERIGEHDETWQTYNITTPIETADLPFLSVIKDAAGRTYRIVSDPREFPHPMSVHYKRYVAERWNET